MNKCPAVTAMMVLTGAMLLSTHLPALGDDEAFLYVDEAAAKSDVKINCKAPGWGQSYPCTMPDPTSEVQNLINQVENHLLIDPDCRGIHYGTKLTAFPSGDTVNGN